MTIERELRRRCASCEGAAEAAERMLARTPKFAFLYVNEKSFSGRILLAREPGPEGRAAVFVPEGLAAAPAAVRLRTRLNNIE